MSRKIKIDTELVISEVQFRPLLWDKQNDLYKNRDARDAAWLEICKEVIPDFESFAKDEQKHIEKKIQQRWRTARDMYKKEKMGENQPSGPDEKKKKKYIYYKILTFLDRVIDTTDESLPGTDYLATPSSSIKAVPAPITLPSTSALSNFTTPLPTPNAQKRKMAAKDSENTSQCSKSSQLELDSDDLAFFQSLQPTLKRFTIYQKMMFRTKVMQTIMEIEDPLMQNYPQTESNSLVTPPSYKQEYSD